MNGSTLAKRKANGLKEKYEKRWRVKACQLKRKTMQA
jgi:hypothetical protein